MSDIEKRLADICEDYFQDLERQAYRPEGCSGDELAKRLVAELALKEHRAWGVLQDNGQLRLTYGGGGGPHRQYISGWERVS